MSSTSADNDDGCPLSGPRGAMKDETANKQTNILVGEKAEEISFSYNFYFLA